MRMIDRMVGKVNELGSDNCHIFVLVQCKYHDLRKAKIATKKKMSFLQARLDVCMI